MSDTAMPDTGAEVRTAENAASPGDLPTPSEATVRPPTMRSRLGGLWAALTGGAIVLLLLLIFILENGQRVDIAYFGAHGHLPVGVALLLAAVFGVLLVVIPGTGRILQLRRTARKQRAQTPSPQPIAPTTPPPAAQEQRPQT